MCKNIATAGQTVAMGKNKGSPTSKALRRRRQRNQQRPLSSQPLEVLETWRKEFRVEGVTPEEMRPHLKPAKKDVSVSLLPGPRPRFAQVARRRHEAGLEMLEVPRGFATNRHH